MNGEWIISTSNEYVWDPENEDEEETMTTPRRILHVLSSRRLTGVAEPVLGLLAALAARGHSVELACRRGSKLCIRAHERGVPVWDGLRLPRGLSPVANVLDVRALRRHIEETRPDIIHLHLSRDHWLGALAVRGMPDAPSLVVHNHMSRALRSDRLHRKLYARMGGIVEVSGHTFNEDIEQHERVRSLVFLPGAVDVDALAPVRDARVRERLGLPPDAVVVAMWARLDPDRKHVVLMEAFAEMKDEFPHAWLLFAGGGEHKKTLLAEAQRLEINERLIFAGRNDLDFDESRAVTDVLVQLAQGSDGSMRTILEGMASGLPVLAADVGVAAEYLVDGQSGVLVSSAHAKLVAAKLRPLLADAALRERIGCAAREFVQENHNRPLQAERLERFYEEVLAPERP